MTKINELAVYKKDDHTCVYCEYPGKTSAEAWRRGSFCVDHWIPRSRGGSDEMENLKTACGPCNAAKGSEVFSSMDEARRWLRIYNEECAEPGFRTFIAESDKSWKSGGRARTWKRVRNGEDVGR